MAYTDVASVKSYLSINSSSDDALIAVLIGQAQSFIERQTNRKFEAANDTTRYFDLWQNTGSVRYTGKRSPWYADATSSYALANILPERIGGYGWNRTLYLDEDLCQITTIVNGDGTTITSDKYVTEPRNVTPWYAITLRESAGLTWTAGTDVENAIAVTGRWAWSISASADIQMATIELAAYLYRRRGFEGAALDQPQVSPSGVTLFPSGMPASVKATITAYQKVGGAE